ncbi:Hypothetical protein CpCap5W_0249 [Corynebacterium pseudotuberculosis]|nr:hypothetical protein CPTA_00761 [Corynebacterium pseudotuberculosis]AIG08827.1 hypothetical protein CPTB_00771 [Corynebacterium pseudotuberculosis]AIG10721.1 hypothetical protein CPTC_00433 [Corynebacterium pseudotuberculosis]AQU91928.1 Hypothetical protein CpMIC6_0252 [Corynebacterium pseudotuberculosis]ARB41820.1 Hypothetical protein CpSigmaE_0239 [Corynebacterium pseudotuberculosis]
MFSVQEAGVCTGRLFDAHRMLVFSRHSFLLWWLTYAF